MSNRDKKLLSVLIVLAAVVLIYYVGYRPLEKKEKALEQENASIETELVQLRQDYDKLDFFESEIQLMKKEIDDIQLDYPAQLNQERAFRFLFDVEEAFEMIDFTSVSFSNITTINSSDDLNTEETVRFISEDMFSSAQLTYDDMKDFLNYVNNYEDKTVLSNLSMSLNEEDGYVTVSLTFTMYGLESDLRPIDEVEFDSVEVGNPILFSSPNGTVKVEEEQEQYPSDDREDLFISLKPIGTDGFAQSIGLMGDPTKASYIESEVNKAQAAIIRVEEVNGQYYWNYDIGGTYKTKQAFDVGKIIEVVVYSSSRFDANDLVALNVTIINQTETPLILSVIDEDQQEPRFNVVSTEGEVIIK